MPDRLGEPRTFRKRSRIRIHIRVTTHNIESEEAIAIGGEADRKDMILDDLRNNILSKEGVYWGRVCNGNKKILKSSCQFHL